MAIATVEIAVSSSAWTLVCENAANAYVQLRSDGPVLLHGATAAPDPAAVAGAVLQGWAEGLRAVQFTGLGASDKLYARSLGARAEVLTVITT